MSTTTIRCTITDCNITFIENLLYFPTDSHILEEVMCKAESWTPRSLCVPSNLEYSVVFCDFHVITNNTIRIILILVIFKHTVLFNLKYVSLKFLITPSPTCYTF